MTVDTKLNIDQEYITQYSSKNQEPSWLLELRLRGLENSKVLDLPKLDKTKIDKWNILQFTHVVEEEAISTLDTLPEEVKSLIGSGETAGNIVIHKNSSAIYSTLTQELKDKGVIFTDIKTAARQHSELLSKYLMNSVVKVDEHKVSALHAALFNCGIFLYCLLYTSPSPRD